MRVVVEKFDDLPRHELARFTNTDCEFARRTFGGNDITIIFGELDRKGPYTQGLCDEGGRWKGIRRGTYGRCPSFPRRRPNDGHQRRQGSPGRSLLQVVPKCAYEIIEMKEKLPKPKVIRHHEIAQSSQSHPCKEDIGEHIHQTWRETREIKEEQKSKEWNK